MPKNIFNSLKRYVDRAKSNARSAIMRASYVDTRSDTTRKGYHEGRTRYGYNYGANENGITGTIARVIDGKDYNPYLQTGIAPMPDKIASPKDISRIYKIFKKVINPKITIKNASKITPKQWTAAQDAAIAKGDIAEAQRLRDLHFKVSAPNTQIKDIQYHGSPYTFNVFDPAKRGNTDQGWFGKGYYFTPSKDYAAMYGKTRPFYINAEDVYTKGVGSTWFGRESSPQAKVWLKVQEKRGNGPKAEAILDDLRFSDAVRDAMPQTKPYDGIFEEVVTRNNNQMKLADAVTYDDNGVRIPLGDRDNFNVNDIRWSWLLPVFGVGAATAVNAKDKNKSKFKLGGVYSLY